MGIRSAPRPVTPIAAILYTREELYEQAVTALEAQLFGPKDLESQAFPFEATDYYALSMGPHLLRKFVTFERFADPAELAPWKLTSNEIETRIAANSPKGSVERPVNIDVGYLTGAKLVLASTKDFAHRIYLRDGIYAEITLQYRKNQWTSHPFTFPDFRSGDYFKFLNLSRDRHLRGIRGHSMPEKTSEQMDGASDPGPRKGTSHNPG